MKEFIEANGGIIAVTVLAMMFFNVVLMGLKSGLELIMDKTKTDADNKVHAFITKVLGVLARGLDLLAGNLKH